MTGKKLYATLIGGDIMIDASDVFAAMSGTEFDELIHRLGCERRVLERAIDFLCDDDSDGWYDGGSVNDRQALLERVEQSHVAKAKYNWQVWKDVQEALKWVRAREHIYWTIYHKAPDHVQDWLRNSGLASNYETKEADADIQRIEEAVTTALAGMSKEKPC